MTAYRLAALVRSPRCAWRHSVGILPPNRSDFGLTAHSNYSICKRKAFQRCSVLKTDLIFVRLRRASTSLASQLKTLFFKPMSES
jgi:hypothetical protein